MAGLPYLPKSLLDTTSTWDFASTTQNALSSLQQAGSRLMQPVGEQLADVVRSSLPAPAPAPQPAQPAIPQMPSFKLPSLESWGMGAAPAQPPQQQAPPEPIDMGPQASPTAQTPSGPAPTPSGGILGSGAFQGFSLPSLADWGIGMGRPGPMAGAGAPGSPSGAPGPGQPSPTRTAGPTQPGPGPAGVPTDVNGYLKYAAGKAGIDPAQVLAVMGKEGPTGWGSVGTFDTGTSYGPLQLHYAGGSNPKEGMGDRFTKATGIDLRKDSSVAAHQAAVDFAMQELAKRGDWSEWYGADNAFPAASGGQGRFTKVNRVAPSAQPEAAPQSQGAPRAGSYTKDALVPNQVTEGAAQGLTAEEALAVCGPAAAVAFARANGRNPTLREAKELAQSTGVWDVSTGMHGPASEVQLLQKMGIGAQMQEGADWTRVAQEVQAGRPVIIDTPNHYYVASAFDPQTGEFEFGQSAGVLRAAKGRTRFKPQDIPSLNMGSPRATIFLTGGAQP